MDYSALEQKIQYRFLRPALLIEALSHSSINDGSAEMRPDSERLEFLGDALLNFLMAEELFDAEPRVNEGKMTIRRSELVNNDYLRGVAERIGIFPFILLGKSLKSELAQSSKNIQSAAVEALLAAIYLDSRESQGLEAVRAFLQRFFKT